MGSPDLVRAAFPAPENTGVLSSRESEPIQIPGAIQPHGVLLAVDDASGRIVSVSANARELLGRDATALLNGRVETLLGPKSLERLREAAAVAPSASHAEHLPVTHNSEEFDLLVHRSEGMLIVELERTRTNSTAEVEALFDAVRGAVMRIQAAESHDELLPIVAGEIAAVSRFERVMVYRFDPDWNGEVVAETKPADLQTLLGLHYPASDIPPQARELYRRNVLRVIPDALYHPVPILPQHNPLTNRPLDLSMSVLRSVSPVHLEYLANMGVRSTLTISLLKHGRLWGMIAAHDREPQYPSFRVRLACELIGRTASLQIAALEDAAENALRMRLRSMQPALLEAIDREGEFTEAIAVDALLQIADAHGAAIKSEGEPHVVGTAPRGRELRQIVAWLEERDRSDGDQPFATDSLPLENPQFTGIKDLACGLLAVPLTTTKGGWLLWFRPEVVRTVSWGGDPRKPVTEDGERVSPRKSFEAWKQNISLHSLPWKAAEIDAAVELRRLLSDVVMRRAREYAKINAELARSNRELESFAHVASHDLKEPLRGIHHYTRFLLDDYGERLDERGREMLSSMAALSQRMERQIQSLLELAEVGHDESEARNVDAGAVLDEALELLGPRLEDVEIIRSPLPRVSIPPARLREVFVNLVSNALKYNDKEQKRITIGATELKRPAARPLPSTADPSSERLVTMFVADNGIGIKDKHLETVFRMFKRLHPRNAFGGGTGAGLAIARKIIEQQGGSMWVESVPDEGSTFLFTVPLAEE